MIEPIMFFGLGFLAASLFALVFLPLIHGRAVRLTARRLEAATPVSMSEIQADKDQLRAEFAMSTRRLEMSVEQLKVKSTTQLADLSKKSNAMNRLKMELSEKAATIVALETRERALQDQLHTTEDELTLKTNALRDAERALAEREAELSDRTGELSEQSGATDSHRIEIVALKTQIDTLKGRVSELEHEVKATETRLEQEKLQVETATKSLADERGNVENLGRRIGQLERHIQVLTQEAENLNQRIEELKSQLATQAQELADRVRERDELRLAFQAARAVETDLRSELSSLDRRRDAATETMRAEKAQLESQLARIREERASLQREVGAMKREAESSWGAERVENAMLRERINDVAAEVVRLTAALEGPSSPIEAILAEGEAPPLNGADAPADAGKPKLDKSNVSLAERIRALQARAGRLSPAAS